MMVKFRHLVMMVAAVVCVSSVTSSKNTHVSDDVIQKLFTLISDLQVKEDVPLKPFKQFYKQKGVYSSVVKLYFHGAPEMAAARLLMDVFDNNMFATAWISSSLLEAYRYGQAPKPTETQQSMAIESFQKHVDRNKPYNNSLMFFWPIDYNETVNFWQATPINLIASLNITDHIPLNLTIAIMDLLGLHNLTAYMKEIYANKEGLLHVFHLCPDMDDTFVNLGLGSLLFELRDELPQSFALWMKYNSNLTSIFDALKKHAYRPFHNDTEIDSIDPRTYMYLRYFLDDAKSTGKDVALVTTWVQSLQELSAEFKKGVAMPLNINNIDVTVCANSVFGITASILSGLVSPTVLEDQLISQIYHNSSALIAYEIQTNLSSRPDLSLLYYPSHMEFNWFVTRIVALLDDARTRGKLPMPVMDDVYSMLEDAVRGNMTNYILSQAKQDDLGDIYFDDFIGDGDFTKDNKPLNRAEDRIFTTAMAVNSLLYTWTSFNKTDSRSRWKTDVPPEVKMIVFNSVNWLTKHTLDGNYDPWNAFFSGSNKGSQTSINIYPANMYQDVNGTALPWTHKYNYLRETIAVKGYIPPAQYATLLKEKNSPLDFHGFNTYTGYFPMWSSEPYTYSVTLLALSRYRMVVN